MRCGTTTRAQGVVRRFVVEQLGDQRLRVAALDESGHEKSGDATAGTQRQYMGCAGRVANGVNTVYCSSLSKWLCMKIDFTVS